MKALLLVCSMILPLMIYGMEKESSEEESFLQVYLESDEVLGKISDLSEKLCACSTKIDRSAFHASNLNYFHALLAKDIKTIQLLEQDVFQHHQFIDSQGNNLLHYLCNIISYANNCYICEYKHHSMLDTLIAKGCNPYHFNNDGLSACFRIFERCCITCLQVLENSNYDFNQPILQKFQYTPLHLAACQHETNLIEFLATQKVAINSIDFEGKTPLYHVLTLWQNNISRALYIAQLLLKEGAQLTGIKTYNESKPSDNNILLLINKQASSKYLLGGNPITKLIELENLVHAFFAHKLSSKRFKS